MKCFTSEEWGMRYKRIVLFGAGASFGSPAILPVSPPLGTELYRVLARTFPKSWGGVSENLKRKFEEHFEVGMEALWSMYPNAISSLKPGAPSPNVLMQDLTRFFISFRIAPGREDVYSKFLIKLWSFSKGDDTCFATLNYEILLEQAMSTLSLKPRVIRPHGGCNLWIKRGGKMYGTGRAVGQGAHCISSRIKPLPLSAVNALLNKRNQAQYPCIAIYTEGKVTQMGQRYLWRAQDRFRRRVLACQAVALIGVRPWPKDHHIWNSIFETMGKVLYVGGERGYKTLEQYRGQDRQTCFISERFENAIEDLVKVI